MRYMVYTIINTSKYMVLINKERVKIRRILKAARQDKTLTQLQLANILGVSENHYQAIELGAQLGSIAIWDALEDFFGIPQRQLRENSPSNKD